MSTPAALAAIRAEYHEAVDRMVVLWQVLGSLPDAAPRHTLQADLARWRREADRLETRYARMTGPLSAWDRGEE